MYLLVCPCCFFFRAERYNTGNTSQDSQHSDLLQTCVRVFGCVLKNTPIVITLSVVRSVVPLFLRRCFILIKELFPFTQIPVYSNCSVCGQRSSLIQIFREMAPYLSVVIEVSEELGASIFRVSSSKTQ